MDLYGFLYPLAWVGLHIWHPFSKVYGRENIPQGGCLICPNHSSMADPVWIGLALGIRRRMHIMAKKEVMDWPIVGALSRKLGAFGVDRGGADLAAVKTTLTLLKNQERVLLFPEGTRVKPGKTVTPKNGAILLALRAGVPILPVYITQNKRPFCPVRVRIGAPYFPQTENRRPTAQEMDRMTQALMDLVYEMGDEK